MAKLNEGDVMEGFFVLKELFGQNYIKNSFE